MLSLRKQLRDMESKSWVVISKETGEAVLETFDRKVADAVNTKKYTVKPILEHLQSLNAVNA